MISFTTAAINVALPAIGKQFTLNAVVMGWIVTAYILAMGVIMVPFGKIADIYGRRKIFVYSAVLLTVSLIAGAMAPNAVVLMTARVFQGIASGMIGVAYVPILISVYPAEQRGRVLGINVAVVYIGLSLAPVIGGLLTQYFGWRSIFVTSALLSTIISVMAIWKMKGEWAEAKGESFDLVGSVIFGLSLVAIIYGVSILPAILAVWLLVLGFFGIGLFIIWENRQPAPVLDVNLFRKSRVFAMSNLAALFNYCITFTISLLVNLYLQYIKGFEPRYAGLILVVQPVMQAAVSPLMGRLSDKIKPQIMSSIGMALATIGLIMFIFLTDSTPLSYIIGGEIVLGVGFGAFISPNTNAIMSSVDKRFYSVASAVSGTTRTVGQMLSLGVVTLLFSIYIGQVQITARYYPQFLQSTHTAFIIFAIIGVAGVLASLASYRGVQNPRII